MLSKGDLIVVADTPEILIVTIKKNFGFRKGQGWLLYTEEGNYVFVRIEEKNAGLNYVQRVIFITDEATLAQLPKVIT